MDCLDHTGQERHPARPGHPGHHARHELYSQPTLPAHSTAHRSNRNRTQLDQFVHLHTEQILQATYLLVFESHRSSKSNE